MGDNPFKKDDGSKKEAAPRTEPLKSNIQVDDELVNLCPFIGTIPVMSMPSQRILANQQMPEVNHVMSPCLGARCAMWDETNEACSIKMANEAMIDIVEPLQALAKAFGKR